MSFPASGGLGDMPHFECPHCANVVRTPPDREYAWCLECQEVLSGVNRLREEQVVASAAERRTAISPKRIAERVAGVDPPMACL